jgi:hypothetical protein
LSALDEQLHRFGTRDLLVRRVLTGGRQAKRGNPPADLASDPKRLAAGGQDAEPSARTEQIVDEPCAGIHEVLAVVKHENNSADVQAGDKRLEHAAARLLAHAHRLRYRLRYECWICQGRQFDQPYGIAVVAEQAGRDV